MPAYGTFSVTDTKCATCRFWDGERTIDFVAYKPRYIKAVAGPATCIAQNGRIARHVDRCPKYMRWEKLI